MSRTRHARPRKKPPMCAHHRPSDHLSRAEWQAKVRECAQRGEWQSECPDCLQHFWPFEMGTKEYECSMCFVTSRDDARLGRGAGRACPYCGEGIIQLSEVS